MKRILSFILAFVILLGIIPPQIVYGSNGYEVEEIEIIRNFDDPKQPGSYYITISGNGLRNVPILYRYEGSGGQREPLTNPDPGSDDSYVQFPIDPNKQIIDIKIGDDIYTINETGMTRINEVSPNSYNLTEDDGSIVIRGEKFNGITNKNVKVYVGPANIYKEGIFTVDSDTYARIIKSNISRLGLGSKTFRIEKSHSEKGANIKIIYNYENLLRIYETIKVDKDNVTIYPNRGKVGTEVTITVNGVNEDFSVFFLEEETDRFISQNMGDDPYYVPNLVNKSIIRVKVPGGLKIGTTYKVVLTNNLDNVKGSADDLTRFVNKQKVIGEFYVVDADTEPTIIRVEPNVGTSAGTYVEINGYRFEELKISGLKGTIHPVDNQNDLQVVTDENGLNRLLINYSLGGEKEGENPVTYNGKEVRQISRSFLVTIGENAIFEDEHKRKNIFQHGDEKEDTLYVKTPTLDDGEVLQEPVRDVVIRITTTIVTENNEEYIFTQLISKPNGFTFLPSQYQPVIESVIPNRVQVEGEDSPRTRMNTILSINGSNFNVFRYSENGEYKTNYPKVALGGTGDSAPIVVERDDDGQVYYTYTGENGERVRKPIYNAKFEVLDRNGNIVTGIGGNETGSTILLTIPEGISIPRDLVGRFLPVAVANPKRDLKDRGLYYSKDDAISFVIGRENPIILEVNPYVVTTEGGEDIIVKGTNFQDGIRVFIDGREVSNLIRDIDRITTDGTLRFKAPGGREGETILQVMNPDGGSDTHRFVYVKTMNIDPVINTISPPKGTKDTLVIIKGNNFLKPDQTADDTGLGFNRLIGSRIFLGNEDVNTYNEDRRLKDYTTPEVKDKNLLYIEKDPWTNRERLALSPYYRSAQIYDQADRAYSIYVNYEGNPVISGEANIYTFKLMGESIRAVDKKGIYYNVDSETNTLTLTDAAGNTISLNIDFDYRLFSIGEDEFGEKSLKLADYYDSLYLDNGQNLYRIEVDDANRVTLFDGRGTSYNIVVDENKIYAVQGSQRYEVEVNEGFIKFNGMEFRFKTPYYIDPATGVITGHRARVKNKNEIWLTIPQKLIPGFYDVTVRNPDTKSHTIKDGFEYLNPRSNPRINYISPSQGSVDGGYDIVIYGEDFEDTTQVYIDGVKVPEEYVRVDKATYRFITARVPKYSGNIDEDFITNKKYVVVTVVNEDGGTAHREDLFAYVIASSRPRIDRIEPTSGTAAGGDLVEIWGYDFRYYEPYTGDIPREGDKNYEDIDKNGRWTYMESTRDCEEMESIDHLYYSEYCASEVLPKVYFGDRQAKIVEFNTGYLKVIAPASSVGTVDVYIVNNDAGTSNKVKFTYEGSYPAINHIIPNTGNKQGGENIQIIGSGFQPSNIQIYDENGEPKQMSTYLVRFGNITNRNIARNLPNSGLINAGVATVNLAGGLRVEYKASEFAPIINISLTEGKQIYTGSYAYDGGAEYINLRSLKDSNGEGYKGYELLRVEIEDGRLLVDRGYAPRVTSSYEGYLDVQTPSYHTIGTVAVAVENPDGAAAQSMFTYKNPDSNPQIDNITRDGQDPVPGDDQNILILQVHYQGGSIITIEGRDFRENALVQIGNVVTISPNNIQYSLPNRLTFIMPAVGEAALGRLHRVLVINEDGGTASSADSIPPIYIEFIKGESNPSIESITPDKGPTRGGTKVTIKGNDFRQTMEGFDGSLKVYFGDRPVPERDINFIDYRTIEVITPTGSPGRVEVRVENPDGSLSRPSGYFTYISGPTITRVEDPITGTSIRNISVKGGREIRLKGREFMAGARVIFAPVLREAEAGETGSFINIDGVNYVLVDGIEGSNFSFIDEETVLITTPAAKLGARGVMLINPDGGATPVYDLVYDLPGLDAPEGVVAELVFDRYIKVHWNPVSGADYYEVYEVSRRGEEYFIGSTELTSFLYKDIEPNTSYRFLVKVVGEYGSSKASALSNTVRTGRKAGYEDQDGDLNQYTSLQRSGNKLNINLGYEDFNGLYVDLNQKDYVGIKEVIIGMPLDLVYDTSRYITIAGEDFTLSFSPRAFRNTSYAPYIGDKDAGIRFKIYYNTGNTNLNGATSLSVQLALEGEFYRGKEAEKIYDLSSSMNLTLKYDTLKASQRRISKANIYYYNETESKWLEVNLTSKIGNEIAGSITRLGRYTILGYRR